jgi:hypothetical protein
LLIIIIFLSIFFSGGCANSIENQRLSSFDLKKDNSNGAYTEDLEIVFSSLDISTISVNVIDDYVEYQGEILSSSLGFSEYSYWISENILFIVIQANLIPDYAETGKIDIRIEDKRICDISRVVLYDINEDHHETVWGRINGFSVPQKAKIEDVVTIDVQVGDEYVVYKGIIYSEMFGYSGYTYAIKSNVDSSVLYIIPYVNLLPDFADDGIIDVMIERSFIQNLSMIILGDEKDNNKVVIWEKDNGF